MKYYTIELINHWQQWQSGLVKYDYYTLQFIREQLRPENIYSSIPAVHYGETIPEDNEYRLHHELDEITAFEMAGKSKETPVMLTAGNQIVFTWPEKAKAVLGQQRFFGALDRGAGAAEKTDH